MPFLYKEKTSLLFGRTLFCAVTLFVDSLSPDTTLTHLEKYHSSLSIAHCCSSKVSLVSKVKPLPVSWRAAVVLTCLSLCAALPGCLRGCHLRGTATALSHAYLPDHCHQMFGAAVTVETKNILGLKKKFDCALSKTTRASLHSCIQRGKDDL